MQVFSVKIEKFLKYDYKTRLTLFAIAVFWVIFFLVFFSQYFRPQLLKVSFYDVGQGDAIFIETPARYQILIDGGPGPKVLEEIAKDMPFYDRTVDLLIATHFDADHISGLIDMLERYQVGAILLPRRRADTALSRKFLHEVKEEGTVIKEGIRSQNFQKIELPGEVEFEILNPLEEKKYKNDNDAGIVNLVRYGDIEFLLLADVGREVERSLSPLLPQGIEVVKVAHHGSKSSSDEQFLSAISPELFVIQVGKDNRYGHPAKETLATLALVGAPLWRTDSRGTLTILSDGKRYWVK